MLEGKVAIVTGASSGIGYATAVLLAESGVKLVVNARTKGPLDALVAALARGGRPAVAVQGDVANEAIARELVDIAIERFGGLDIAINNAGAVGVTKPIAELGAGDWAATLDVNLTSAFYAAKHQAPAMERRGGGSIVFVSSFVGTSAVFPGMAAYAAAKAGLIGLTKAIAIEFATKNVRSNVVLPGGIDTPANVANLPGAPEGTRAFVEGLHAMKRMGAAEEVARVILHLSSDASSFVTGASIQSTAD